jgi:hypothetical protein
VAASRHTGETVPASLLINQIDDECPHGRPPLLTRAIGSLPGFRTTSSVRQKGFVARENGFVAGEGSAARNEALYSLLVLSRPQETAMKIATLALVSLFTLSSTFALAQTGGAGGTSNSGMSISGNALTTGPNTGMPNGMTTGSAAGNRNTDSSINPLGGPAAPHDSADNPALSPSPSAPASPTNK